MEQYPMATAEELRKSISPELRDKIRAEHPELTVLPELTLEIKRELVKHEIDRMSEEELDNIFTICEAPTTDFFGWAGYYVFRNKE